MKRKRVLVAGATGYLGQHLVRELNTQGFDVRVLIRKEAQKELFTNVTDYFIGEITKPESLNGICTGIDYVFTSIGITRQKDGLTYMDVDYQGNANLLREALKSDVDSFLYVSAIGGDKLRHLKIFEAKERFVDELKASGLNYTIMRPNGFFSDMRDFLDMARKGKVYLFGRGEFKLNPIHGVDLAKVCIEKINADNSEFTVGGPDMFSQNELARLALNAWGKSSGIVHLPDWIRKFTIWSLRTFTSSKTYGPLEFFLTLMAFDNMAEKYGSHHLSDFFKAEVERERNKN